MAQTPKNHRTVWTPTDEAELRALVRENMSARVIALKLGRTPRAIASKAARLGIALGVVTEGQIHHQAQHLRARSGYPSTRDGPPGDDPTQPHSSSSLTAKAKELMSFARSEFTELRGEINQRINLQHAAIQRALSLFGITATIAVAFFAALVRTRDATEEDQFLLSHAEMMLMGKAAFVLVAIFCLITMLLICNWIYQLYLIFRIHDYTAWLAREAEAVLRPSRSIVLRYARHEVEQPWAKPYDRRRFRYLQILVLYSFTLLSLISLAVLATGLWDDASVAERAIGLVTILLLAGLLPVLLWIHISLHHVQRSHATGFP